MFLSNNTFLLHLLNIVQFCKTIVKMYNIPSSISIIAFLSKKSKKKKSLYTRNEKLKHEFTFKYLIYFSLNFTFYKNYEIFFYSIFFSALNLNELVGFSLFFIIYNSFHIHFKFIIRIKYRLKKIH